MGKKNILIIDDEVDLVELVKMRLEANNYNVTAIYDGQQALNSVWKKKFNLIILDVMLPKIDGYWICELLKKDNRYKNVPIILFTSRAREEDKKFGDKVGADAYITKPFDPQKLIETVNELVNKHV